MEFFPQKIYTDRFYFILLFFLSISMKNIFSGLEFESGEMKKFFDKIGIQKLAAKNSKVKAAVAERAIRTFKNR